MVHSSAGRRENHTADDGHSHERAEDLNQTDGTEPTLRPNTVFELLPTYPRKLPRDSIYFQVSTLRPKTRQGERTSSPSLAKITPSKLSHRRQRLPSPDRVGGCEESIANNSRANSWQPGYGMVEAVFQSLYESWIQKEVEFGKRRTEQDATFMCPRKFRYAALSSLKWFEIQSAPELIDHRPKAKCFLASMCGSL